VLNDPTELPPGYTFPRHILYRLHASTELTKSSASDEGHGGSKSGDSIRSGDGDGVEEVGGNSEGGAGAEMVKVLVLPKEVSWR